MTRTCENPLLQCWFFRARTRLLLQVVLTSVMSAAFDSSSRVCSHWRVTSCPLFVGSSLRRSLSAWAVTCVLRCIMCLVVKPCRLSFEERWQFGFIRTVVSWLRGICRLWTPAGTEAKPEDPAPMSFCPTAAREPPLPPPPLGFQQVPSSPSQATAPQAQVEGAELMATKLTSDTRPLPDF